MLYRRLIRPIFFRLDPEIVHRFVVKALSFLWSFALGRALTRFSLGTNALVARPAALCWLPLKNQLGLAAGFDKNAELALGLETLGFGFVEIGTVTPRPQPGNPKPRIFRDAERRALINRLGFNNDGALIVAERLRAAKGKIRIPVGVNVGKNKDTPLERAKDDYVEAIRAFRDTADYFTINVSSPNTPNLRDLQNPDFLSALADALRPLRLEQPLLLKLAPEIQGGILREICKLIHPHPLFSGLILTNTIASEDGGISGGPLRELSLERLKEARALLPGHVPLLSVGGIMTPEEARLRLASGANAVQVYTGLIYEGPGLVRKILEGI